MTRLYPECIILSFTSADEPSPMICCLNPSTMIKETVQKGLTVPLALVAGSLCFQPATLSQRRRCSPHHPARRRWMTQLRRAAVPSAAPVFHHRRAVDYSRHLQISFDTCCKVINSNVQGCYRNCRTWVVMSSIVCLKLSYRVFREDLSACVSPLNSDPAVVTREALEYTCKKTKTKNRKSTTVPDFISALYSQYNKVRTGCLWSCSRVFCRSCSLVLSSSLRLSHLCLICSWAAWDSLSTKAAGENGSIVLRSDRNTNQLVFHL